MSSFNDMLADFKNILNRDDCSTTLATTFLTQAMQRIQRTARLPSMERVMVETVSVNTTQIAVPADLLQVKDIFVTRPTGYSAGGQVITPDTQVLGSTTVQGPLMALQFMPYRQLLNISPSMLPKAYSRLQSTFQIAGAVLAGSAIELHYYGAFSPFATADDANEISSMAPDVVVYGALSIAGDFFQHPSTSAWEQRYEGYLAEVIQAGEDVDAYGGPMMISSAHPYMDSDW